MAIRCLCPKIRVASLKEPFDLSRASRLDDRKTFGAHGKVRKSSGQTNIAGSAGERTPLVKRRETFYGQIGNRLIALAILATLAITLCFHQHFSSMQVVEAQARRQQRRIRPRPATQARRTSDTRASSSFKHEDHRLPKADRTCSDCHSIPTQAAPDVVAAKTKPSIKGYPYHDSCLECHRTKAPQFFRGTTPTICTVCHTRSSPRLTAREMSPFPKNIETRTRELVGYFSHGSREHRDATRKCATCHPKDERKPIPIRDFGSEAAHTPAIGTFKSMPFGHASCFQNCHWDKDDPKKDDCAGCHFAADALAQKRRALVSPNAAEWFTYWPREWPKRLSLKFNHDSKYHREEENPELVCTSCHNKIRRSEPLEIPDVPISTCAQSGCHFERASRTSIHREMREEDDDIKQGRNNDFASRTGQHTCTGCHTDMIGKLPPPCSHYLLFEDKYFKSADYPISAKQLFGKCKK